MSRTSELEQQPIVPQDQRPRMENSTLQPKEFALEGQEVEFYDGRWEQVYVQDSFSRKLCSSKGMDQDLEEDSS